MRLCLPYWYHKPVWFFSIVWKVVSSWKRFACEILPAWPSSLKLKHFITDLAGYTLMEFSLSEKYSSELPSRIGGLLAEVISVVLCYVDRDVLVYRRKRSLREPVSSSHNNWPPSLYGYCLFKGMTATEKFVFFFQMDHFNFLIEFNHRHHDASDKSNWL